MSVRAARRLFIGYFALYAAFLLYPGVLPFNRIRPFVLGLPFSFFWVVLWVAVAFVVFLLLDRAEVAHGGGTED